jgi:hypothetical protein
MALIYPYSNEEDICPSLYRVQRYFANRLYEQLTQIETARMVAENDGYTNTLGF